MSQDDEAWPKFVAKWINNDLRGILNKHKKHITDVPVMEHAFLIRAQYEGFITRKELKEYIEKIVTGTKLVDLNSGLAQASVIVNRMRAATTPEMWLDAVEFMRDSIPNLNEEGLAVVRRFWKKCLKEINQVLKYGYGYEKEEYRRED